MSVLGWLRRRKSRHEATSECALVLEIRTDEQGVKNMMLDPGTTVERLFLMMEGLLSEADVCIRGYTSSKEAYIVNRTKNHPHDYVLRGVLRVQWDKSTEEVMRIVDRVRSVINNQGKQALLPVERISVRAEVRDLV